MGQALVWLWPCTCSRLSRSRATCGSGCSAFRPFCTSQLLGRWLGDRAVRQRSSDCIDFLTSIIRRARKGISPLRPDNGHLHNRLHRFYDPKFKSRVIPNSLTGLTISFFSSGVCLLIYLAGWLPIESGAWFAVFAVQAAVYLTALCWLRNIQIPKSA